MHTNAVGGYAYCQYKNDATCYIMKNNVNIGLMLMLNASNVNILRPEWHWSSVWQQGNIGIISTVNIRMMQHAK